MSKFPSYSINNCILIASQYPQASLVCGYHTWQKEFNRTVNKGEKGIMIIAPIRGKCLVEEELFDENNRLMRDGEGNPLTEWVTREYQSYKPVYVFDIGQTSGEPVPSLATTLEGDLEGFESLKEALFSISPVPITFEGIEGSANGYYAPSEGKIVIEQSLPPRQMIKTMIHEIAHAELGHGGKEDKWDRRTREIQAESVAFWVCQMVAPDMDASEYSFGYISGWSSGRDISELKENLDLIKQTADGLSQSIEERLKEMKKDRQEMAKVSEPAPEYPRRKHHR